MLGNCLCRVGIIEGGNCLEEIIQMGICKVGGIIWVQGTVQGELSSHILEDQHVQYLYTY